MADAKDYLELWRERYSFPSYIGDNFRLSEDGTIVLDNEKEWSEAQKILLQSSAVGTSKNFYLDPKPLFNKLGEIYTNIINSSFKSARTDSIKMNRNNMDYTNGSGLLVDQTPVYPFFCFLYGMPEETSSKDVYNDWYNENVVIDIISAISENNSINNSEIPNIINIDSKLLQSKTFPSFVKTQYQNLRTYLEYYTRWYSNADYPSKFSTLFNEDSEDVENFWKKHWYCIRTTDTETSQELEFYLPNEKFVEQFRLFKKKMPDKVRGLQLLMPQYHRRVEIEDLDENFWVISVILDAVVNALWGPYGLIDVVRQLILKVTQIEDFLGLDKLTGIELLHSGSDDMYFDMYSRFTLSGLELKLKTQNGERIIKNIFKGQSDTSDRNSTTDAYDTREELFAGIQLNEITPTINDMKSTGLYDSDLISSSSKVPLDDNNREVTKYLSLNTVIDAINNKIVNNNDAAKMTYTYSNSECEQFFAELDITPDGTLTPNDLKQLSLDVTGDFSNLTQTDLSRLSHYQNAKTWLENNFEKLLEKDLWKNIFTKLGIENKVDIEKLFITKKGLMTFSAMSLDMNEDNTLSDNEWLNYANEQLTEIKDFIINLYNNVLSPTDGGDGDVTLLLQDGSTTSIDNLYNMYNNLEAYFYRDDSINISNINNENGIYYVSIIEKSNFEKTNTSYISFDTETRTMTIFTDASAKGGILEPFISSDSGELVNQQTGVYITTLENDPFNAVETAVKTLEEYYNNNPSEKYFKKTSNGETKNALKSDILNAIQYNKNVLKAWEKQLNVKTYKFNFKEYNKIGLYPTKDIYTYNEFSAKLIAQYLATKASKDYTQSSYFNFIKEIDQHLSFYQDYFDTSKMDLNKNENNTGINVIDCANIMKYLNLTNDAYYFYNMELLRNSINKNNTDAVERFNELLTKYQEGNLKKDISNNYSAEKIRNKLFTKKIEGHNTILRLIDICVPSQLLIELINSISTQARIVKGYEITEKNKKEILGSIATHDYKLYGNILLFLYDEDYYHLQMTKDTGTGEWEKDEQGEPILDENNNRVYIPATYSGNDNDGLYVTAKDCFYGTEQPLIKYSLFFNIENNDSESNKDNTYALFIPRKDLINGEIIQLRLTEKNQDKKMLNFNNLDKDKGFNELIATGKSSLFLSLHNCFSSLPGQYNFRTTLFFDSTTPENVPKDGTLPFKNVNDWFCNGIECQYFRPNIVKENESTMLGSHQFFRTNLQIKASMISKKDPFNDNSFIFEEGPYDDPKTTEVYYTFSRRQAYCAAQRHNLLFYASPATVDGDMFIHSPLQLLQTPSTRSGETIQPTRWNPIPTKGAVDVMSDVGSTCAIADVKNMLYKNSLTSEKRPLIIDAIWGSRYVDNYVKNKKMQYIVIEREPGARHHTYGPNCIGFSQSNGYLHANNKTQITSLNEKPHWENGCKIDWYDKYGKKVDYANDDKYLPPANAKYGVVDLTKFDGTIDNGREIQFANNYMIRFYSSNLSVAGPSPEGETPKELETRMKKEFSVSITGTDANKDETIVPRRPIFRMAYFFGEDESGRSTIQTGSNNK